MRGFTLSRTLACQRGKVASLGLEPRITESKSGVLPLHYEAFRSGPPTCGGRNLNRVARVWQQGKSIKMGEMEFRVEPLKFWAVL